MPEKQTNNKSLFNQNFKNLTCDFGEGSELVYWRCLIH